MLNKNADHREGRTKSTRVKKASFRDRMANKTNLHKGNASKKLGMQIKGF